MLLTEMASITWLMQVLTLSRLVSAAGLSVLQESRRVSAEVRLQLLLRWLRREMNITRKQACTFLSVQTAELFMIII